jgi:diguanylate cyclase (GGDEF)-like protein/PAS domain S-box-containing protein
MNPQAPLNSDEVAVALDALLAHQPPLRVVAINPNGHFVPMPACVPVPEERVITGPASGLQLVVSGDIPALIKSWQAVLLQGITSVNVHLLRNPDEEVRWCCIDTRDRFGVLLGFIVESTRPDTVGVAKDPAKVVFAAVRPPRWTATKDESAVIIDVDSAVTKLLGWDPAEMIGRRSIEFIHPEDLARATANWMDMLAGSIGCRARLRHQHRDGSWVWFEFINRNRLNEPAYRCVQSEMIDVSDEMAALVGEEVSARKRIQKELVDATFRDPLTDLPNRSLFIERLRCALQSRRAGIGTVAVLLLDCDRFQSVNNSFGHATGDRLLVALACRLQGTLRQGDTLARIDGDEFAVLIEEGGDDNNAVLLADRMLSSLSEPFALSGTDLYVRASIGVVTSAQGYESADEMLRDADIAMYQAKAAGRHRCEVFHVGLRDRTTRIMQLDMALRHAIERNELAVHYQPIIALASRRIVGVEALLRWQHPHIGAISPVEFIPIAEENGIISEIGEWVLRQACRQTREFQTTLPGFETLTVNVNVSVAQFRESGFIETVDRALRDTRLPSRCLHVELTESLLMHDLAGLKAILAQLRERGIEVHIDDFGTGYSSLAYLDQLSVQTLKIDKSFVSRTEAELANPGIVETILTLARQLGVTVTAEGIETPEQERALRALDCKFGQGFLFSQALEPEKASAFMSTWSGDGVMAGLEKDHPMASF